MERISPYRWLPGASPAEAAGTPRTAAEPLRVLAQPWHSAHVAGSLRRHARGDLRAASAPRLVREPRQATWSSERVYVHHFRTSSGLEVDLLLENAQGRLVAVEVKAARTLQPRDFKAMRGLQALLGSRLHRGIVLHAGEQRVDFGPDLRGSSGGRRRGRDSPCSPKSPILAGTGPSLPEQGAGAAGVAATAAREGISSRRCKKLSILTLAPARRMPVSAP